MREFSHLNRRAVLALLACVTLPLQACSSSHPTDAQMIERFRLYRESFNQLVAMAQAEKSLRRIAADFVSGDGRDARYPQDSSELPLDRWKEYRTLFDKLSLDAGIELWKPDQICLLASTQGLSISGSMKGYIYSSEPLAPLASSLDEPALGDLRRQRLTQEGVFRPIEERWYLVYQTS